VALKHLKFIVCGSYVKQVWPPLEYTNDGQFVKFHASSIAHVHPATLRRSHVTSNEIRYDDLHKTRCNYGDLSERNCSDLEMRKTVKERLSIHAVVYRNMHCKLPDTLSSYQCAFYYGR
jgi:hypothetical protein